MNRLPVCLVALLLASPAFAADTPPPAAAEEAATAPSEGLSETPKPSDELPEKITLPPPVEDAPTVQIRTIDNGDVVEEYRVNGRLTMVRVKPRNAPEYTLLDTNGDGRLDKKDAEGPVAPVYWTLYEWN